MRQQFIDICTKFAQTLLPQSCVLCHAGSGERALCDACLADLPWHRQPVCPVCAMPSPQNETCGACLKHAPAFDRTRAALAYHFPADKLLQRHKFGGKLSLTRTLAQILTDSADDDSPADLIIPMPLHPARLRERGFNQAVEIARHVARQLHIPLALDTCTRTRATRPQSELPLADRHKNLRGAFDCRQDLRGRHVILLDDIMTTGASLDALAGTVRKAGAASVACWVVARTLRD